MNRRFLILTTLATIASVAVLLTETIPLGIPGEWQWSRHASLSSLAVILDRLAPPLLGGILLVGVAIFGSTTKQTPGSHLRGLACYVMLALVSWIWLDLVQQAAPTVHRDLKPYWVLYSPSSSGYFFEAAFKIDSTSDFLNGYEDRMSEGEVLHVGTHPPGLFLLSKACLSACESSPRLVSIIAATQDKMEYDTFRRLEIDARLAQPLSSQQTAALQLLGLLSRLAIVLTIIPLAVLSRALFSRNAAWWICCLWPTLPCLSVFFPKSDVLFPFTASSALTLAVLAIQGRRPTIFAIMAGLTLWFGLMLSLAHIPVAVVLFCLAAIRTVATKGKSFRNDAYVGVIMIGAILICSTTFSIATDCNIATVWNWNLTNHAGFYQQFQRTWYKWLAINPLEFALAVGVPTAALGLAGLTKTLNQNGHPVNNSANETLSRHLVWATAFVWMLLWISGKNQGEAARLWCFVTPWLLLAAGDVIQQKNRLELSCLLILQTTVAIITLATVNGFAF